MSELEGHFDLGTGWPLRKDEPSDKHGLAQRRRRFARFAFVAIVAAGGIILAWHYWTTPHPILTIPNLDSRVHFSPGGLTLAASRFEGETDIYRVSDGALLHKLAGGGIGCAWNLDGSLLAVARSNWPDIELWDSRTWTMQKRLSLCDSKKGRPTDDAPYGLECYSLCFDRWDNLYVVELSYNSEPQRRAFPYKFSGSSVFWRASDTRSDLPRANLFAPIFVTVASLGDATRLVCAGSEGVGVWSVQTPKAGPGVIERKYSIPPFKSEPVSISLTADGKYLLASTYEEFFIFELFDDHAEMIRSEQRPGIISVFSRFDVAANAPLAGFMELAKMTVLDIPSARSVLEIPSAGWMTLSPNGRLVATKEWERHSVKIYRVPQ